MKLSTILIIVCTLQISANVYAQTKKFDLSLSDVTVKEVLKNIESQSDFRFFYNDELSEVNRNISIDMEDVPVNDLLTYLFKGTGVTYKVLENNLIVISPENLVQQRKVTGKIIDSETLEPLPGVTVQIEGTTLGTITALNGSYEIDFTSGNDVLIFSFVGYVTQKVTVGSRTTIDVALATETTELEEVVVIGYGTQKKVNLTGVVEVIKGDDLMNRATTTVSQSLQGKTSGITFTTSRVGFEPGAELSMQIRGQGSPLVLIDGVPGSINSINPNDIESMSILKDAASAAIYGARAAYGVVLITTKSGLRDKKIHIGFSSSLSGMKLARMPHMADSYTTALAYNEASVNTGTASMYKNDAIDRIIAYQADPTLPETVPSATNAQVWGNNFESNANYDWFEVWYGNGTRNQENLSVNGGSEIISYYLNLGHTYDGGVLNLGINDNFRRYNTDARIDIDATKWLKFTSLTRYYKRIRKTPSSQVGGSSSSNVGYPGLFWWIARDYPSQYMISPNGVYSRISWIPLNRDGGVDTRTTNDVVQRWAVKILPSKGWTIDADYSMNLSHTGLNSTNFTVYEDKVDGSLVPIGGTYPNWIADSQALYFYNTLNAYSAFKFNVAERNHFSLLIGYQLERSKNTYLYGRRNELITQDVPSLNLATGIDIRTSGNVTQYATQGLFSRLSYDFDNKYLIEFNGRYDGTYKFARGKRWGFFPSVSAGWIISNEGFWQPVSSVVNLLKIRGSVGELGNQNVAAYQDLELMGVNSQLSWVMNGIRPSYVTAPNLINRELTWETSRTTDLGVDLGLLKNKLLLTADVYKRFTFDELGPSDALPAVIGVSSLPNSNNMETISKGWEFSLTWTDNIGKDFNFSITAMLFDVVTKINKYNNPTRILTNPYAGQTVGEIWGYVTRGLIQTQEDADRINTKKIQQAVSGIAYKVGDIEYLDLNGDTLITRGNNTVDDPGDRKIIGNTTPRYQYGLNLRADWKGINFSMLWQGTLKRDLMLNGNMMWGFQQTYWSTLLPVHLDYYRDMEPDNYKGLGINKDAYFPRPYNNQNMNNKNQQTQTRYLQNAAFTRLKNVQIGYAFPGSWLEKIKLEELYLYFSGDNLWTITPMMNHLDPETADKGVGASANSMPSQAVLTIGLNVKF